MIFIGGPPTRESGSSISFSQNNCLKNSNIVIKASHLYPLLTFILHCSYLSDHTTYYLFIGLYHLPIYTLKLAFPYTIFSHFHIKKDRIIDFLDFLCVNLVLKWDGPSAVINKVWRKGHGHQKKTENSCLALRNMVVVAGVLCLLKLVIILVTIIYTNSRLDLLFIFSS